MDTMATLSEVLNKLKNEGYTVDFNLSDNCLICHGNSLEIYPNEFVVDDHFRFEGISDPGDEAVVYAISSEKHKLKGTLVDGYGIYSDGITSDLVKALKNKAHSSSTENTQATSNEKFSEPTSRRPGGNRQLDAPLVEMDLSLF